MGCCLKLAGVVAVLASVLLGYLYYYITMPPALPEYRIKYWGPGQPKPDDKTIKPFKIQVPQSELKMLKTKLDLMTPLTPPLEGIGFEYGMNTEYLTEVVEYWKTKYNWTEREILLNKYPHFRTQIGGLDIHFIHVKPDPAKTKGKEVLPLVLVHGWPSSVREFYEIIPYFTAPRDDADFVFEVIAPSLPGFTFSQGASKPGLGSVQMGVIINELMTRLGFDKYFIQGGDWGAIVGYTMSVLFPQRVRGYHTNFCVIQTNEGRLRMLLSYIFPSYFVEKEFQKVFSNQLFRMYILESGYFHIQATKPDTVGVGLTDSPVGLAGYILEKFAIGPNRGFVSSKDGGLDHWDRDYLLDNVMLYWVTKSITTSVRIYKEGFTSEANNQVVMRQPLETVPSACARFPHEIFFNPMFALKAQFKNIISVNDMPRGGHFAALEEPQLLADDVWEFVSSVRAKEHL